MYSLYYQNCEIVAARHLPPFSSVPQLYSAKMH